MRHGITRIPSQRLEMSSTMWRSGAASKSPSSLLKSATSVPLVYRLVLAPGISVGLCPVKGKPYLKAGGAWLGLYSHEAGVLAYNALYGVQAETEAASRRFRGEKGLKDAGPDRGVNPGAIVPYLDERHRAIEPGNQPQCA